MKHHVSFDLDFKRNPYKGKFIAIEGIDGCGKTMQTKTLAKTLEDLGQKVFLGKNPTNGIIGKFIRQFLSMKIKIPPQSFQYLFSADRQMQQEEIIKRLENGETVITDRYFWSAVAYGMADMKIENYQDADKLLVAYGILSMYNQFILPNFTFYLDLPVELAMQRLSKMDKQKELYEEKEKLTKIAANYKWLIGRFKEEFVVIDATKTVEEVVNDIISNLKDQNAKIKFKIKA